MSAVLGLSGGYHDAAAALVVDGALVAALHEERLSRIKQDPALPLRAARAALDLGGIGPGDLDQVVFYEDPYEKLERVLVTGLRGLPRSWRALVTGLESQLGGKLFVLDQIAAGLGVDRGRVTFRKHHECHAASAFLASPFDHAAVLTVDGVGEWTATAIWEGRGAALRRLRAQHVPHSLGLFYAGVTGWLGFPVNGGEYRVMGLAAYGRSTVRGEVDRLLQVGDDGVLALDLPAFGHFANPSRGFGPELERRLGPARPPGRPWDLSTEADQRYADVAASAQDALEDAILALAHAAWRDTHAPALCLAGGVALNCKAVARLAREGPFAQVFVQPAAGDAGGALGAALLGAGVRAPLPHARWGRAPSPQRALALARALGLPAAVVSDPPAKVADCLESGGVVAVCSGRAEWGPRALGQRSLLARATDASVPDHLNRVVKLREPFRPFAPAVAAEALGAWFEGDADANTPFMTTLRRVTRPDALPAITHVDGTARVQSVTARSAPLLRGVLDAVAQRTGVPVVLNTSLNGPGEPMCDSATDALGFFSQRPVEGLLVEDVWVGRPRS